ncbi:unnamed protein product [Rotaria magnacalcarata]|uniref:Methyltransferase domain-containing protein n=1 Tax=Rotaria magnacalcarata TaxID=392030 RepID=A0A816PWG1_9BILA|nr:unnamed protein product [Rotaria magnacalcarata]CAF1624631.1 unnamed protein product [Rotaria magnacalcarata]CAF2053140.1 unnamed protein product [Rotaria magnacalcarata]CAF2061602.1 unnamed protein product [Rotaria magnacalcarata]CAF3927346.1 unnamed protein product [Rotaria magnacalcarata]
MNDNKRKEVIDSWHKRADAYEILVNNYQIFTDMAMGLVKFVEKRQTNKVQDFRILDLAAGTGLVSKLLIQTLHISPASLYLVEPAEQMCILARGTIKTPHVYQMSAEDCLSTSDLPRDSFDFILCNASMHLMSENDIYPIVSKLLKPKTGYFLYTLWYHAFDETENFDNNQRIEAYINDALTYFKYPNYFSTVNRKIETKKQSIRSRKFLQETAYKHGIKLESCAIHIHQVPMSFDLDFMLMEPSWLMDHLKNFEWTQNQDAHSIKGQIVEKLRELIKDEYTEKPVVQIVVSRI